MKRVITFILVATIALSSSGAFAMSNNFVSFQIIQQTCTSVMG